jgi:hypothetical protein
VWTNKDLNLKLIIKGLLTRIYVAMVIVQGLKEAGVISKALTSEHAALEKSISKESSCHLYLIQAELIHRYHRLIKL